MPFLRGPSAIPGGPKPQCQGCQRVFIKPDPRQGPGAEFLLLKALKNECESTKHAHLVSKVRDGQLEPGSQAHRGRGPPSGSPCLPLHGHAGRSRCLPFVAEPPQPPLVPGVGAGHGGHWGPLSPRGPARITGGIQKPLQGKVTGKEPINKPMREGLIMPSTNRTGTRKQVADP